MVRGPGSDGADRRDEGEWRELGNDRRDPWFPAARVGLTMRTIYFVRHGQTTWNAEGRLQGQRDVDLNAVGLEQAAQVGDRLRAVAGDGLAEAVYLASPLTRARRTMEILRGRLGLEPEGYRTDPRLMEIHFGAWEGSTWSEIRRRDPAGAHARDRDRWGYRPPGLKAESYAMLTERVGPVIAGLDRDAVVVAHGGVARAMLVALGLLDIQAAPRIGVRQGVVLVVEHDGWRWA
ncbi:Glucosyl-3-phosphoglycerate phosphatase [Methylobacterium dankookense]|uniref:2,3-bisphosphoglycerate-dependent phosphoglycerate mutase n=2 Tax=Methylobacterium dankookense TaxID=560405 RepID=A0A564FZY0_9HYPH|nr:2,3-bisphosphoglycerate-dependent phosphoglycerate mutase [Methylobacterium dankookense]VUF13278.1 Glucosyl-3-phosphoglycerate phosphatase [Methylobacterium dankookense]